MAKQIILAVAGAGKTHRICNDLDQTKRNLILAFTHENIFNIQSELRKAHGSIPESTTIATFDSFIYHNFILPYEPSITQFFDNHEFRSNGITMVESPRRMIKDNGKMVKNCCYVKKNALGHYINKHNQYYCDTLSELIMHVKNRDYSLLKRAANRLIKFYDAIYIDEFQDYREYDYEVITSLAKTLPQIVLVGDYYQHSVSGRNNSGKPFKAGNKDISYSEFIKNLQKIGLTIDKTSLSKSRRCTEKTCQFVTEKLGIEIQSSKDHSGSITWIDHRCDEILTNDSILKLVYSNARKYSFRAMNWSYSKGNTVEEACVILTEKFENLDSPTFSTKTISSSTINKLYVALTRSCGNLYLMKASTFNDIKDSYRS